MMTASQIRCSFEYTERLPNRALLTECARVQELIDRRVAMSEPLNGEDAIRIKAALAAAAGRMKPEAPCITR
jgi:hypothetical protein